jgi:hypothetical protein
MELAPSRVSRDHDGVGRTRQSRAWLLRCCRRESNPTRPAVGRQLRRLLDAVRVCHTAGAIHATHALGPVAMTRWRCRRTPISTGSPCGGGPLLGLSTLALCARLRVARFGPVTGECRYREEQAPGGLPRPVPSGGLRAHHVRARSGAPAHGGLAGQPRENPCPGRNREGFPGARSRSKWKPTGVPKPGRLAQAGIQGLGAGPGLGRRTGCAGRSGPGSGRAGLWSWYLGVREA